MHTLGWTMMWCPRKTAFKSGKRRGIVPLNDPNMSVFCSNWVIHPDAGIWSNLKSIKTDHPSSLFNKSQSHLIQLFFRFEFRRSQVSQVNVKWIFEHPIFPEENNQRFVPHLQSLLLTNLKDQGVWRLEGRYNFWGVEAKFCGKKSYAPMSKCLLLMGWYFFKTWKSIKC